MNEREPGLFVTIEGGDGSGKGTQTALLNERLLQAGYKVSNFDFPRYEEESSHFVREYLNGAYGSLEEVGPRKGSLFFAMDRFGASSQIREAISSGAVVLSNRYVASNMAHQGSKIETAGEREEYYKWLHDLEYGVLGIPKPDLNIVLHVPALVGQKLVDEKGDRGYLQGKKRDIHESDAQHLIKTEGVYLELCELFPEDFWFIECVDETEELLSIETIHEMIWEKVKTEVEGGDIKQEDL